MSESVELSAAWSWWWGGVASYANARTIACGNLQSVQSGYGVSPLYSPDF